MKDFHIYFMSNILIQRRICKFLECTRKGSKRSITLNKMCCSSKFKQLYQTTCKLYAYFIVYIVQSLNPIYRGIVVKIVDMHAIQCTLSLFKYTNLIQKLALPVSSSMQCCQPIESRKN